MSARPPNAAPIPIPAFAPVERPEDSSGDEVGDVLAAPEDAAFAEDAMVVAAADEDAHLKRWKRGRGLVAGRQW